MSTFLSLFPDNNAKARFLKRIAGELHLFVKTPEFLVEVLSLLCTDQCLAFLQQTAIRLDTLVHDKETLFRLCALLPSGKKTAMLNEASLTLEAFSENDQEAVIRFCLKEWERPLELALVHRLNPGLWKSLFKLLNLDVNRITPFELQSILADIPSEQWHRFIQESGLILKAFVIREPRLLHIIFSRLPENSIPDFLIREDIQICRAHYLKQLLQQLSPENQKRFFETNSVNLHSLIETGADLAILAPLLHDEQFNTFLETSQNLRILISTPSCLIAVLNRLSHETWREFFIKSRLDPALVFSHSYALKDLSRTHPKLWEPFLEQMQPILPFKTLISDATALLAFFEGMSAEAQGIFLKTCGIRLASIINTGDDLFHFLNLLPQSYWNLFFQKAAINIPQLFDNKKKLQHFLNGMTNIDNKSGISIEAIAEKIAEPDKREDTILFLQILLYALPQSNVFFSASGLNPNDLVKTAESLEIISLNWPHGLSTGFLRQIGLNPEIIDAFETIAAKITHSFARWTICERANGYATPWRRW